MRSYVLAAALLGAATAHAGYYTWETVTLPASSGAACGDGSPYRIFVNRALFTKKTVVMFEGGGACWSQGVCEGAGGILGASNPSGVPSNYLTSLTRAFLGYVTPFTSRLNPVASVQTQSWNIVYVPYCTGDVHVGNKIAVYSDRDPAHPRTEYHRGDRNIVAAANWLAANMYRPDELLVTGFSAGGTGSTAQYATIRNAMNPKKSSLLNDSGPFFNAPRHGDPSQHPSSPLHDKIRDAWGLEASTGIVPRLKSQMVSGGLDVDNFGSLTRALAKQFPADRFGYTTFQRDGVYSMFSYSYFYDSIRNAPTDKDRFDVVNTMWMKDVNQWVADMSDLPNVGYYVAYWRGLAASHTMTVMDFGNTGIEEAGLSSVKSFINNTLDRSAPPIKAFERDTQADYKRGQTDFINILGEWVRPYLSFLAGGLDDPYSKL
ncbi:MAG TPA: pectin acetylesterase-family hydrolase [Aquabacterium sp.]|nr:pectin acetylesterase-family hydrolase [Aquabacterium sp.]